MRCDELVAVVFDEMLVDVVEESDEEEEEEVIYTERKEEEVEGNKEIGDAVTVVTFIYMPDVAVL